MIWEICSVIISLILCCSCNEKSKLDDIVEQVQSELKGIKLKHDVDPTVFACLYNQSMTGFDVVKSDNKAEMLLLSEKLNNGRNLSLFFLGTGNTICRDDHRFKDSKEWYIKSGTNICYIAYAFDKYHASIYNLYFYVKRIMETNRVEYVAQEALELVMNVRKKCLETKIPGCVQHMSQVTVLGYSLGAHIGAYTCRYLIDATGEKVKKLIGLDAAAISHWVSTVNYIQSGDADYVQVVHTSYLGTQMAKGDSDIYIKTDNWNSHNNHRLAVDMNALISAKKLILIGSKNGKGRVINLQESLHVNPELLQIADHECVVGVYNQDSHKNGNEPGQVYMLSLPNKSMKFY
ncbi:phospholipase A1-like [Contarinia nasturtii]|uniref:phospholipase A1-like n=1 Tax=Contarinia nasturtii TaxID=265458 RepID=UPI0012D45AF2|nr:phospholipase A1-like [Contarinia nasturtii]